MSELTNDECLRMLKLALQENQRLERLLEMEQKHNAILTAAVQAKEKERAPPAFVKDLELKLDGKGIPEIRRRIGDATISLRRASQALMTRSRDLADRCSGDAEALDLIRTMLTRAIAKEGP